MPNPRAIDAIIGDAISKAMSRVVPAIQRHIATLTAQGLEENLTLKNGRRSRQFRPRRARPSGDELTRWVTDKRARRVPNFVIKMTGGLDTKKKIVAKYGENVVFKKGKPLPRAKA